MKDSNLRVVWGSFSSPSNTILPGQTLKSAQILYSKGKGASNYSIGNFLFELQNDGYLVLRAYQWSSPPYWYVSTQASQDGSLVYNGTSALLYVVSGTTNVYPLTNSTPTPVEDYYHRATIDENGTSQCNIIALLEGCKKSVMDDCNIIASTSTCAKKRMPLLNAMKSSSSKGQKALLKVPNSVESRTLQDSKKKNFNVRLFLKVMVAVSATLACLCGALAINYHPFCQRLMRRKRSLNVSGIGINFRQFTFQELQEATNGFSKILGKGSSGKVYHGTLTLDNTELGIAVKKLEKKIEKSEKEFMTKLKIIGRTHHRNLVRLLGFCNENNHRILVYEFMPNGALSSFLFGQGERPPWGQRIDMALGIARGLLYLHEECENQIIHCDIKPQNVLLDANHIAKIADFGLSKLLNKDQSKTSTNFRGTIGYIAPEWLRGAPITSKVDIFSFGVMLLEITCCKRHIETSHDDEKGSEDEDLVLSNRVLRCMAAKKLELVVENDPEALNDFKRFEEMVLVGLWCAHPDQALRPSMKHVMQMLEGTVEVEIPPLLYNQMIENQSL